MKVVTTRVRTAFGWITAAMIVKRWQMVLIAFTLGVVIASLVNVGLNEAANAEQDRKRLQAQNEVLAAQNRRQDVADQRNLARDKILAAALRRLERLENPTLADIRRAVRRFNRLPASVRAEILSDLERSLGGIRPPDGGRSGDTRPDGGSDGVGTPGGGSQGTPGGQVGTGPVAPAPSPPPPDDGPLSPVPTPPQIDFPPIVVPPIDLDGPDGPLPPVTVPPIDLPPIP